jgi:hypothetical protein
MTTTIGDREGGRLVTDSRVTTYSGLQTYASDKLYRAGKSVFGEAGDVESLHKFRRWALDDFPKKSRPSGLDEFYVLEISPAGLWLWDKNLVREAILDDYFAIGSGAQAALYAIRVLGKTPEDAIVEASKVDIHTAPPVQVLALSEK